MFPQASRPLDGLDYAGFELQIVKHVADGKVFIDTETIQAQARIKRVPDIYVYLASKMFDVPEENITPAMRQAAKNKVYWVIYR